MNVLFLLHNEGKLTYFGTLVPWEVPYNVHLFQIADKTYVVYGSLQNLRRSEIFPADKLTSEDAVTLIECFNKLGKEAWLILQMTGGETFSMERICELSHYSVHIKIQVDNKKDIPYQKMPPNSNIKLLCCSLGYPIPDKCKMGIFKYSNGAWFNTKIQFVPETTGCL